jgi:putative phosphoesterase
MKILLVSDSHGKFDLLHRIYKKEKAEYVLFAGDYSNDGVELSYVEDSSEYLIVKGNCDVEDYANPAMIDTKIGEYKILLTHGHLHGVKKTYNILIDDAKNIDADIVVFGHTHIPHFEIYEGIYLINPGAVKDKKYAIIEINGKDIEVKLKRL